MKMEPPKYYIVPPFVVNNRDRLIKPSLVLTAATFLLVKFADMFYTNSEMPLGQVSLQFAATKGRATRMLTSISRDQLKWVHYSAIFGKSYG